MTAPDTSLALVGNPRPVSRTAAAAELVLAAVSRRFGRDRGPDEIIDLGWWLETRGAPLGPRTAQRYAEPLDRLRQAQLLVVATPIYKGSYPGLLKAFLDHLDAGALHSVVAIPVITVGSPAHTLAGDVHLRPLLLELGASVPTRTLVLLEQHLADPEPEIEAWLDQAAPVLARALGAPAPALLAGATPVGGGRPYAQS